MNQQTISRVIRRGAVACGGVIILGLGACGGGSGHPAPAPMAAEVPAAPAVTTQPKAQSVDAGKAATFSVSASGSAPLSYQWLRNGTEIAGATSASYTTAAVTLADSADVLRVVIKNDKGSVTSDPAVLLVEGVGTRILAGSDAATTLARVDGVGKEARLQTPGAMAFDSAGNLLVVETERKAIRKVSPTGVVTTFLDAGASTSALRFPHAIAAGANGTVYVTDGDTKDSATALRKVGADGAVSNVVLPADPADLRGTDGVLLPLRYTALATDGAGDLYVASQAGRTGPDTCSSCVLRAVVRKIAPDGKATVLTTIDRGPSQESVIVSLAADKAGNVYALTDAELRKIDAAGVVSTVLRNEGLYLNALALDAAGNLYFTGMEFSGRPSNWATSAIGKVTPQGTVQVLADPAKDARFATSGLDSSNAIAVDATGAIYLSRFRTIRKLVLP